MMRQTTTKGVNIQRCFLKQIEQRLHWSLEMNSTYIVDRGTKFHVLFYFLGTWKRT
jgi:hypothetical protein